ncbi:MAG TPA: hypothetical protein VHL81_09695 [Gemmatimonadales bacterium]|jgi:hypothetical protein|nr:hypothetical protein [Gemmatimonadales bacterium]
MEKAEVEHGQEIRADLPGVRVMSMARDWLTLRPHATGEVFFCTMGSVRVRKESIPGDGRTLPTNVILDGLDVPAAGTYDLLNVLVRSNGDLRLIMDEASRAVRAPAEGTPVPTAS